MEKTDKEFINEGRSFINQLSIVFRTVQLHDIENVAVTGAIEKLLGQVSSFVEGEGRMQLELVGEFIYINKVLIKYPLEMLLNFEFLAKELKKRELGEITFLSDVNSNDIKILMQSFNKSAGANITFDIMVSLLKEATNIEFGRTKEIKEQAEEVDRRRLAKMTYFNAVSFTKGIMTKIRSGDKVNLRKAKRVVGALVDAVFEDEPFLIGMTTIKDYDEYTYNHSVNVSILSITIGQKIGLKRNDLILLGMEALLHDIGKTGIPLDVLNKPSSLSQEEWRVVQRHPYLGALSILKLRGIDPSSMQAAIVAFQHHMNYDLSGYPKMTERVGIDFHTRIVGIADQYDAMTSARVYSRVPHAPDKALSIMMDRAGTQLDPVLYKFFVNMIGIYPIGSLVILDTKEMGLVYECNHLIAERPRVMIIVDSGGNRVDGAVMDMTEKDEEGNYRRNIVSTADPNKYKVNLAEYLL